MSLAPDIWRAAVTKEIDCGSQRTATVASPLRKKKAAQPLAAIGADPADNILQITILSAVGRSCAGSPSTICNPSLRNFSTAAS
jgi:hypothetical protein